MHDCGIDLTQANVVELQLFSAFVPVQLPQRELICIASSNRLVGFIQIERDDRVEVEHGADVPLAELAQTVATRTTINVASNTIARRRRRRNLLASG